MNIAILTTARSDFGLLKNVIRYSLEYFKVDLLIAGSHFISCRGDTVREIEEELCGHKNLNLIRLDTLVIDGNVINHIETLVNTQRLASNWFSSKKCDLLLFLGDRWELWGATLPAFLHQIPLAHISGGEITEGAIDDAVRHSHTKLAALHFVANDVYATNISRMGEEDWRINVVGECGLDEISASDFSAADEILAKYNVDLKKNILLVTFHPSTLDFETPLEEQMRCLLKSLNSFPDYTVVFTAPAVEQGAHIIISEIRAFVKRNPTARYVENFGRRNYLAVMRAAKLIIGNSSSGITEAPSLGVPVINIGERQRNRITAASLQHVNYDVFRIEQAIRKALDTNFQHFARSCLNPYDPFNDGKNSERIVTIIYNALSRLKKEQLLRKKFQLDVNRDLWNTLQIT